MDQVVHDQARADEALERLIAALAAGVIVLDANREIVWMDAATRQRLNGGMEDLAAALRALQAAGGVTCSLSAQAVTINGAPATLCLIQPVADHKEASFDPIAAIESTVTESASWFTRAVLDRLKAVRQTEHTAPRTSDLDLLSDREREVLGLICEGRNDAQMSDMLGLSQNTVRNHIAALYRKIGVNRRTAAIIWARERGITAQDALGMRRRTRPRANSPQP